MNRLNRKIEYALMALQVMSEKGPSELTSAKEVCQKTGSPFDATSRVMQILANHEILKSVQGAQGGYILLRELSEISIYDLIEKLLGPLGIVKCINGVADCDLADNCNIQSPLGVLNSKLISFYKEIKVCEILDGQSKNNPVRTLGSLQL